MDSAEFGKYMEEIAGLAKQCMREEYVGEWLTKPIPALNNETPVVRVWNNGATGRRDVIKLLNELSTFSVS